MTPTNRGHGIMSRPIEAPPWGLTWRLMELRPNQWGTTTKLSWNYFL